MAEAVVEVLLGVLNGMIQEEIGLIWGVNEEMQKLSSLLSTLQLVVADAEEKQLKDFAILNWLQNLNCAACEIEDILDECATETARFENRGSCVAPSSFYSPRRILFRHRIGKQMKEITRKLNAVAEERMKYHLIEKPVVRRVKIDFSELRETGFLVTEPEVVGRNQERDKIVDILVNQINDNESTSVLPIVGIGGLGKTTLVQYVFNDAHVIEHFELKLWVCISNDFVVKKVIKLIIESAKGTVCEALQLSSLQEQLQELLRGKRYLLVLDNLWNDDPEEWEKLNSVMECGSRGSSMVVTTRMQKVASIVGTLPTIYLSNLSEEACWLLFSQRAFESVTQHPNLVAIGKEIVKKCGGVPLAAKALGSLLRFKRAESDWLFVKESQLWNLPQDHQMSILPALKLSYHNLPLELRKCFAYCAIFPKNCRIQKQEVIQLWMAHGLVSPNGRLALEDVGNAIWVELYWRSFFQDVMKDELGNFTSFKLHDLIHDLAGSIMQEKYGRTEFRSSNFVSNSTIRQVTLLGNNELSVAFPKVRMREKELTKFGSLRVFNANRRGEWMQVLVPSIIANLKHLRYLDLSHTATRALPNTICNLWNLQTLNLNFCHELQSLPQGLRCLRNLRHLHLEECLSLTSMPKKIGRLTCLQTLSKFIVGKRRGYQLSELRDLNLVRGNLSIQHLERVGNQQDAEEANLIAKQNLRRLYLSWDDDDERWSPQSINDQQVLEALEPCPSLHVLHIKNFKGTSFPDWVGVPTLTNVVEIYLHNCDNCTSLPTLGDLPVLQRLSIGGALVEYIDEPVEDGNTRARYPSLKELYLYGFPNLKGFIRRVVHGREVFPNLHFLMLDTCPMLALSFSPGLLSLKDLTIKNCRNMALGLDLAVSPSAFPGQNQILHNLSLLELRSIGQQDKLDALLKNLGSLGSLKHLSIQDCPELESFPENTFQGLTSLEEIRVFRCWKLQSLPRSMKGLQALRELELLHMSWAALPEEVKHVPRLRYLRLDDFPNLISLPEWLGDLQSLQRLRIMDCPKLVSLPTSIGIMSGLHSLFIGGCPVLASRCMKEEGEDWYKIAHIPDIDIRLWAF